MQFAIGIRIVGFTSFVLGILLLCVCGWTYHKFSTGEIGKNSTLRAIERQAHRERLPESDTLEITSTYSQLKTQWKEFKPFLMGSGGVALAGGIIQVVTSLAILCSGPKGARERTGCFKMTHFIVAVGLIVAIVVPAAFDVTHDSWSQKLRVLFHQVKNEIHTLVADEGFNPDVVTAYYSVIAVDVAGILLVIFSTCCLMRNAEYDYREYP